MRSLCVLLLLSFSSLNADAVSLTGRPTDDSVCDLSPLTNYYLGKDPFVEAGTINVAEIYSRLALRFITIHCRNDQVLILHSEIGDAIDDHAFRAVVAELCNPVDIKRESTATTDTPYSFQIKCKIVKIQDASRRLAEAERTKSAEAMIEEGAPIHSRDNAETKQDNKEKCGGKLTFGELFLGLGGHCQ